MLTLSDASAQMKTVLAGGTMIFPNGSRVSFHVDNNGPGGSERWEEGVVLNYDHHTLNHEIVALYDGRLAFKPGGHLRLIGATQTAQQPARTLLPKHDNVLKMALSQIDHLLADAHAEAEKLHKMTEEMWPEVPSLYGRPINLVGDIVCTWNGVLCAESTVAPNKQRVALNEISKLIRPYINTPRVAVRTKRRIENLINWLVARQEGLQRHHAKQMKDQAKWIGELQATEAVEREMARGAVATMIDKNGRVVPPPPPPAGGRAMTLNEARASLGLAPVDGPAGLGPFF